MKKTIIGIICGLTLLPFANTLAWAPQAPAAPTNASVDAFGTTFARLTWTDNAPLGETGATETGFYIDRSTDGINFGNRITTGPSTGTELGGGVTGAVSYMITGLTPNTQYWFKVASFNEVGSSAFASANPFTTLAGAPAAPANLTASLESYANTKINLTWTSAADYTYLVTDNSGVINSGWISGGAFTAINLQCNTQYTFNVKARNQTLTESSPSTLSAYTSACAPTNFTSIPNANDGTKATLNWTSLAGHTYRIQSNNGLIDIPWFSGSSYNLTNLACNQYYNFSLIARNQPLSVEGGYSSVGFTTAACAQAQQAKPTISSFTITNSTQTSISFAWQGDATYYNVKNETSGDWSGWESKYAHTYTGLTCGQTYLFSLQGSKNDVYSDKTTLSASTLACAPANPATPTISNVTFSSITKSDFMVSWSGTAAQYKLDNSTTGATSDWASFTSYGFGNLTCGTSYSLILTGRDVYGNLSAPKYLIVTTLSCSSAPPIVNNPPSNDCPALYAGDMVKVAKKAAIYALNGLREVMYFPSGDEFKSWNADDKYGNYKTVSMACFDSIKTPRSLPGAVNFRPGSYIVKRDGDSQLYAITDYDTLSPITAAAAKALYGSYRVMTIPENVWSQYIARGPKISSAVPHSGMLIKYNNKIYYVEGGGTLRPVTAEGFIANRLRNDFVHPVTATMIKDLTISGAEIFSEQASIADRTRGMAMPVTSP